MLLVLLRSKQCSVKCVYLFKICCMYEEKHGSRIFRTHTDFYPAVHRSNTRNLTPVPTCTVALFSRTTYALYGFAYLCLLMNKKRLNWRKILKVKRKFCYIDEV